MTDYVIKTRYRKPLNIWLEAVTHLLLQNTNNAWVSGEDAASRGGKLAETQAAEPARPLPVFTFLSTEVLIEYPHWQLALCI